MGAESKRRQSVRIIQIEQKILPREGRLETDLFMVYCITVFPTGSAPQGTGLTMPTPCH